MTFILETEPKAKETTKNKPELQKKFIEAVKLRKWDKIKGKVAVEITVCTNQKTPPQIQKVIKNILDIMHKKELLLNKDDEPYLPLWDDKSIKYLRAKYVFIEDKSYFVIKMRPFSSFISDIHFVETELDLDYESESTARDNWEDYSDFIHNKKAYLKILSKAAYESMLNLKLLDVQKDSCDLMNITPPIIRLLYPKRSRGSKHFRDVYRTWASSLLGAPIRIHLPGIPLNEKRERDYKTKYVEEIKKQMRQYLATHPIFNKFQSPILITVFYMPPRKKKRDYKDIDNIMLEYIMPAMNDIYRPPVSLFGMGMSACEKNDFIRSSAPKSLNGSAIGYEIIELPYNFAKVDTGFIIVGFKIEDMESSIIDYVDEKIEKYMEENEYLE